MIATALLIIDMQNDFVSPEGAATVAGAAATVPAIRELLAIARTKGWTVIYIKRCHEASSADAEKFRLGLFKNGHGYTVNGTWGAEVVAEIAPKEGDIIVCKTRFSAFFATTLDLILRRLDIKRLVICGTQYPNCIRATATDAMALDYDTMICTDCTSAASAEVERANIHDLENMGVKCLPLSEIVKF